MIMLVKLAFPAPYDCTSVECLKCSLLIGSFAIKMYWAWICDHYYVFCEFLAVWRGTNCNHGGETENSKNIGLTSQNVTRTTKINIQHIIKSPPVHNTICSATTYSSNNNNIGNQNINLLWPWSFQLLSGVWKGSKHLSHNSGSR